MPVPSDVVTIRMIDISHPKLAADVTVQANIFGVTIRLPNGDALDLIHNEGVFTLNVNPCMTDELIPVYNQKIGGCHV